MATQKKSGEGKKKATPKKTPQEMIAFHEEQIAKLKEKVNQVTSTSPGMSELLEAFENAKKQNSLSNIQLINNISRIKRLGLTISTPIKTRKPKAAKIDKTSDTPSK